MTELKRVSFNVAKAIKEAGYPQEWHDTEYYYTVSGELKHCNDYEGNNVEDIMFYQRNAIPAPSATDIWLWLWREKKIHIEIREGWDSEVIAYVGYGKDARKFLRHDPEEIIITVLEYLATNNLIK